MGRCVPRRGGLLPPKRSKTLARLSPYRAQARVQGVVILELRVD